MKVINILDSEQVCTNCTHYVQHWGERTESYGYGYPVGSMFTVNCGHCTYPRVKDKKPNDTCKHFELRD